MPIKLIVGLANDVMLGSLARDNVGALWVRALCNRHNIHLKPVSNVHASMGQMRLGIADFNCAITSTHASEAGRNIAILCRNLNLDASNLLVVHDDMDFDPGTIRLKSGSNGSGHKGIIDIAKALNSKNFHRLRVGIGQPEAGESYSDYLSDSPCIDDKEAIDRAVDHSFIWLPSIVEGDWQSAMNALNTRTLTFRPKPRC